MHEDLTLKAGDGHEIPIYRWRAEGKPRGIVQISHGMAEHAGRYEGLATALNAVKWTVYAHDHRGHGKSAKRDADVGHFADREGWLRVREDLRAVRVFARDEEEGEDDLPLVLFAHSMGSFIAISDVIDARGGVDALVLSASNRGGGALVRAGLVAAKLERLRQGRKGKSDLLAFLSFGTFNKPFEPARTEFEWLSRDPAEVDRYIADPRCGFRATNQLWIDLLEALIDNGKTSRIARIPKDLPVHLIAGTRDPVSDMTKGLDALRAQMKEAGLTRVSHRFYPDARHELLHETNRDDVIRDLIEWLEQH